MKYSQIFRATFGKYPCYSTFLKQCSLHEECPNTEFFLVRINTDQKKLYIWTLSTQWLQFPDYRTANLLEEGSSTSLREIPLYAFLFKTFYSRSQTAHASIRNLYHPVNNTPFTTNYRIWLMIFQYLIMLRLTNKSKRIDTYCKRKYTRIFIN